MKVWGSKHDISDARIGAVRRYEEKRQTRITVLLNLNGLCFVTILCQIVKHAIQRNLAIFVSVILKKCRTKKGVLYMVYKVVIGTQVLNHT